MTSGFLMLTGIGSNGSSQCNDIAHIDGRTSDSACTAQDQRSYVTWPPIQLVSKKAESNVASRVKSHVQVRFQACCLLPTYNLYCV
jgi:hypothetical protein